MSKGNRIRSERRIDEVARLRAQKEELIQRLAAERTNNMNAGMFVACLVKRLGAHIPDGVKMHYQVKGWRVLVTDEEADAIDISNGELVIERSTAANGVYLTLYKSEAQLEMELARHEEKNK